MSSPWIEVTAPARRRARHPERNVFLWNAAIAACVLSTLIACGTPQKGGPRRVSNGDDEDAGAPAPTSCAELECASPAICIESVDRGISRASCMCPKGYRQERGRCVDVDECARPEDNNCDANSTCENHPGSFTCRCKPGFGRDGDACKSLDSCVGAENTCHPSAACSLDATGGVECKCAEGFEGSGKACVDVDECENGSAQCAENAHCINTREAYSCACDVLFTGDGMVQCRDRCEAAQADPERCDPGGRGQCVVDPTGEARCTSCNAESLGDGLRCTTDSECAALDCGANTVCGGSPGARACECRSGFEGDPLAGCTDVNECAAGTADCDPNTSRCVNTPGSYVCECKTGFERNGTQCVNIDECALETDRCDPNSECVDKTPGYECACNAGFENQPDGLSCADVDECANGTATCREGDTSVMCVNTLGGYDCRCPKGYAGDGKTEACYCDLSGWWALRQDATLIFPERSAAGQVLVTKSVTYASVWELQRFQYDGDKIVVERKACGSDVAPEIYSPLYDETYSSWTPNMVFDSLPLMGSADVTLPKSNALPGQMFTTPRTAIVNGLKMNDPLNDPWPTSFMDISADRWVDTEDDGEPGLSLWPIGTNKVAASGNGETLSYLPVALEEGTSKIDRRLGCASVALRTKGAMRINIDSCDTLSGNLLETAVEGRVHSCTVLRMADWESTDITCSRDDWKAARRCTKDEVEFLDMQDQSNMVSATFDMQKLGSLDGPDFDCAAVRAKLPAIVRNK